MDLGIRGRKAIVGPGRHHQKFEIRAAAVAQLGVAHRRILTPAEADLDRRYKKRLLAEIDELAQDYRQRFKNVLDDEVENVGKTIEIRVRQGVLDAVASLPSSEVIQGTTQSVVRTGVDLVEAGLSTFLGARKPDKP